MRRIPAVLVALAVAASLVVLSRPASAAGTRSFRAASGSVRAGQLLRVAGKGCRARAFVQIYLSGIAIGEDRANARGEFVDDVEIPTTAEVGRHRLKAGCSAIRVGTVVITVLASRFNVSPRRVEPGRRLNVTGRLCRPRAYVTVKLGGTLIGDGRASAKGRFHLRPRVPDTTSEAVHRVSARCDGSFVGAIRVVVDDNYPSTQSLITTDRTVVPAGQPVTLSGSDCPTRPTASLDGRPLSLEVEQEAGGDGFTATATIPAAARPGRHTLQAGCEAGSSATTELQVLAATTPAAARRPAGGGADPAIWLGLLAGVTLLAASLAAVTRGRRS